MHRLVLVTVLCFTTWVSSAHAIYGPTASSCCIQWSITRPPLNRIMSYTIQSEGVCRISAVRFLTVSGKTICSNPKDNWTEKAILKLNERRVLLIKEHSKDASTTHVTPEASILPETTTGHSATMTQKQNETTEQTQQESVNKASKSCSEG